MNKTVLDASPYVLEARGLCKTYKQAAKEVLVLDELDFKLCAGERVATVGSSGSGKTTLLNLLGGLDVASSGSVSVAGQDLNTLTESQRGRLRNRSLGFVYQFHHLLGEFSAQENVGMPLLIAGISRDEARARSLALLKRVGLEARSEHKPSELSGGERQRVAIARALVNEPAVVLMDEPTGNLDRRTALGVHQLMQELSESFNTSFVVVTHDEALASTLERKLSLVAGKLIDEH